MPAACAPGCPWPSAPRASGRQRGIAAQQLHRVPEAHPLGPAGPLSLTGVHLAQIRRYEGGATLPTFEILRKLAIALTVPADALLFENDERGPDEDLRLHFEALARLDPEERQLVKGLIESVVLKHDVRRSGLAKAG